MSENKQQTATEKKKVTRQIKGVVVSDKLDKTIVVEVMSYKTHKKYRKKYRDSKKYKVHDEGNKFKVGDKVVFAECQRWQVISEDKE